MTVGLETKSKPRVVAVVAVIHVLAINSHEEYIQSLTSLLSLTLSLLDQAFDSDLYSAIICLGRFGRLLLDLVDDLDATGRRQRPRVRVVKEGDFRPPVELVEGLQRLSRYRASRSHPRRGGWAVRRGDRSWGDGHCDR